MKRILLVKTSSLGDVVHNLPVASDISAAFPECAVDWVVEEDFAALPRLHPAVAGVLPVAIRRWRRSLVRGATRREIGEFLRALRSRAYDIVIDTQGLLKSALIASAARGARHGLDWRSAREPLAVFYDRTWRVPRAAHAVARNRSLAALALGYAVPGRLDYGIRLAAARPGWLPQGPYAMLLHATSEQRKLWGEEQWIALGRELATRGMTCVLPGQGERERARGARIAQAIPGAFAAPRLPLAAIAGLIAGAAATAGVDTGLTHLAGALGVPTAGIYCATDPLATGLYGCARAVNVGGVGASPRAADVLAALERLTP
ncbi:MAG: lipopolysaccharide heptosyltransferase I [Burkholderiales bacterium]|nr:lipopolysaccharide heptosyltransferase I [Burkholderiales bacterium]